MSIKTNIEDGDGSGRLARVSPEGFLYTQEAPYPPADEDTKLTVYREFLTQNGDGTTTDMRVNGATTSEIFYINAEPNVDIYITTVSFLIADAGASLSEFGGISARTNGCRFYYEDQNGEINIGTSLVSNFEFVRLCQGNPAFGGGSSAFLANNVVGSSEAFIPVFDFRTFGFKWGLKLAAGTNNRLVLEINDNVSGIDAFNAIAYGFRRTLD
jgi:hypothetical protein